MFHDFNTSHVNVNPVISSLFSTESLHFNTSHVNVNHSVIWVCSIATVHFNTSHVNVNHDMVVSSKAAIRFQYISC